MRSASAASSGSWVTSSVVTVPRRLSSTSATRARASSSRWAVGSSSSSSCAPRRIRTSARASADPLQLTGGEALRRPPGQAGRPDAGQRLDDEGLADDGVDPGSAAACRRSSSATVAPVVRGNCGT